MLPYKERIHKEDFVGILKQGKRINTPNFSLIFLRKPIKKSYFAVVISKKTCPKAHDRNALKRKIHSLIQRNKQNFPEGYFIIFPKDDLSSKEEIFLDEVIKNLG